MDMIAHLRRQMAFSRGTFGPDERTHGCLAHIRKELTEIEECPSPLTRAEEWVDVVLLSLDGLTRSLLHSGLTINEVPAAAVKMIERKQGINEDRTWPDWRTLSPADPIEHRR